MFLCGLDDDDNLMRVIPNDDDDDDIDDDNDLLRKEGNYCALLIHSPWIKAPYLPTYLH